jgi:hypothetical protein
LNIIKNSSTSEDETELIYCTKKLGYQEGEIIEKFNKQRKRMVSERNKMEK